MIRLSNLHLIVATDMLGCIGKGNTLPWRDKEEMEVFKEYTTGDDVVLIVSNSTLKTVHNFEEFIAARKKIYAITTNKDLLDTTYKNVEYTTFSRACLEIYPNGNRKDIKYVVIGGPIVYNYFMPKVGHIRWSVGNFIVEDGDTYFTPDVKGAIKTVVKELQNFKVVQADFV